jgi:hypothetical protein
MVLSLKRSGEKLFIKEVHIADEQLVVEMNDGQRASIPFELFPRLKNATTGQRLHMEISPSGYGIHWPEIDEDISVKAFLLG